MSYFQAYQAFQTANYDRCLRVLEKLDQSCTRVLDLKAQVHFMRRDYQEAYDIYQKLVAAGGANTEERKENLLLVCVCAALEKPGSLKQAVNNKQPLPEADEVFAQVESIHLCNEPLVLKRNEKKKRKRSGPPPKNMVPGSAPDPERWIPKRDRKNTVQRPAKNRRRQKERNTRRGKN